jgi:hypothetical protein
VALHLAVPAVVNGHTVVSSVVVVLALFGNPLRVVRDRDVTGFSDCSTDTVAGVGRGDSEDSVTLGVADELIGESDWATAADRHPERLLDSSYHQFLNIQPSNSVTSVEAPASIMNLDTPVGVQSNAVSTYIFEGSGCGCRVTTHHRLCRGREGLNVSYNL